MLRVKPSEEQSRWNLLRHDFFASIVTFLVALPLCIGIAVAVGVSPARALITGIIGGLIVGFFSGCPLQVSGPAAGLFVLVADLINTQREKFLASVKLDELDGPAVQAAEADAMVHALTVLGAAGVLAGLMQLAAGAMRFGPWFRAVSPAVIKGMLAGIGVLIVISQVHVMLDHQAMYRGEKAHGGLQYIATIPEAIWKCINPAEGHTHHIACLTGLLTIALIIGWETLVPKRIRIVPGPLVAIVVASAFAHFAGLPVMKLEMPRNLLSEVTLPSWGSLAAVLDPSVVVSAIVIAVVASAETLLCATAVDQMHSGPRTNYDRELTAQGVGNVLCGLLGALPMTGVIVRSSANVRAGAKSRLSTMLHGAWLLVFVAALPWLLEYIPRGALGAMLVYTGLKLIGLKQLKKLWSVSRSEAAIYLVTMTVIVVEDLLVGVLVGVGLSAAKLLMAFSRVDARLQVSPDGRKAVLKLQGAATFVRLPLLASELDRAPPGVELHVDLHELHYIDHACLDLLMNWATQHEATGGSLVIDWERLHARFRQEHDRRPAPLEPQARAG